MESFAYVDCRYQSRLTAVLNFCRTTFVCAILGLGTVMFSSDATKLVLNPIERMVRKVQQMSTNPLLTGLITIEGVANRAQERAEDPQAHAPKGALLPGWLRARAANNKAYEENMETRLLERSIGKICSLMAVGFGEAGSEIIAENMRHGGALNPMVPGRKVVAIFGFCDIRQFTDTTEVLQEGIMEFVNLIAKIVHTEARIHRPSSVMPALRPFTCAWLSDLVLESFSSSP